MAAPVPGKNTPQTPDSPGRPQTQLSVGLKEIKPARKGAAATEAAAGTLGLPTRVAALLVSTLGTGSSGQVSSSGSRLLPANGNRRTQLPGREEGPKTRSSPAKDSTRAQCTPWKEAFALVAAAVTLLLPPSLGPHGWQMQSWALSPGHAACLALTALPYLPQLPPQTHPNLPCLGPSYPLALAASAGSEGSFVGSAWSRAARLP